MAHRDQTLPLAGYRQPRATTSRGAGVVVRVLCAFSPVGSTPPWAALSASGLRGGYG
jgi:hypothetical protein